MGYGFTLSSNPFDTVVLRINPPLTPEQQAIHSLHPPSSTPGIYHLSPHSPTYPPALTHLFTILTATPTELPRLHPSTTASATLRNTLAAHSHLLIALRQKLSAFPREPALPPPTTAKRRAAKTYRDAQLAILVGTITECEDAVQTMLAEHPAATTLSSILSTNSTFTAAIERCFGTDDEAELERAEQADIVFTLYICWQYILHLRHVPTQSAEWKIWIARLVSETKYGATDEAETVAEAEEFVRELYEGVFPAAAEAAPDVFAGGEWTVEVLSWGMRVFGGEGVGVWVCEDVEVFVVCVE